MTWDPNVAPVFDEVAPVGGPSERTRLAAPALGATERTQMERLLARHYLGKSPGHLQKMPAPAGCVSTVLRRPHHRAASPGRQGICRRDGRPVPGALHMRETGPLADHRLH